jgi:hypothetical protein
VYNCRIVQGTVRKGLTKSWFERASGSFPSFLPYQQLQCNREIGLEYSIGVIGELYTRAAVLSSAFGKQVDPAIDL